MFPLRRSANTTRSGGRFSDAVIEAVWQRGKIVRVKTRVFCARIRMMRGSNAVGTVRRLRTARGGKLTTSFLCTTAAPMICTTFNPCSGRTIAARVMGHPIRSAQSLLL